MNHPLIILDRDGVINYDSPHYIKSPDEWIPIPGSLTAIADLNRAGYRVVIATNQSGIARGLYDLETLSRIHEKLIRELATIGGYIEEIFFCPHLPSDNCDCRKPKTGMFKQIQKKYLADLSNTFFIGDSLTDMQAAIAVPCKPIFLLSKGEHILASYPEFLTIPRFPDLSTAVQSILET
ncbi:MAG: D-glycero-beta-D-manno-heptose,7-bisphosphate 7-phosphatase [Gammaproteobacteria bacterium]|jgi:D-glycero-D-manno-heptose 1,7-bisphosphate phosphatase|nr:D-glycero-beta-D-manno-heptose,7-bisphosphate 7-phosphatase [Gammaproteobacteria bacterium]MCE3237954.1 D-glycero-beta-D-manno-heptose,7-bisphosphate 7-phosphatase [Gammaproteobacteria bacterium]